MSRSFLALPCLALIAAEDTVAPTIRIKASVAILGRCGL